MAKKRSIPADAEKYTKAQLMDLAHAMGVDPPVRASKADILRLCQKATAVRQLETRSQEARPARKPRQAKDLSAIDARPGTKLGTAEIRTAEPVKWPRAGRPMEISEKKIEAVRGALQRSAYIETAAASAGIAKSTLYDWLRRGERLAEEAEEGRRDFTDEECLLVQFSDAIKKELADAEIRNLDRISNASRDPRYWMASAWILERRHPEKYGRRDHHTVENPDGSPLVRPLADALRIAFGPADAPEDELLPIGEEAPLS